MTRPHVPRGSRSPGGMRIDRRRPIPLSAVVPSSRVSSQRASLPYARPPMPRRPPSRPMWLHEIKHDGFRVVAKKQGERVKLQPPRP